MANGISRRDFLNGTAIAIAAGLAPFEQLSAGSQYYPPALTGLRGSHDGAFEVAHALAREGQRFDIDKLQSEESYDLVIIGAGIAGLSAAWFFRERRPDASILILDNHDDFGGHARRCEHHRFRSTVAEDCLACKVLIKDWSSFKALGVHAIAAPTSFHSTVKLDYPVSLGAYQFPKTPNTPIGVHMVHVPLAPNQGLDARDQLRAGRAFLLSTPFEELEAKVRGDLDRMLGAGGFKSDRDVLAITANRWSHGYSYFWNSLYDDVEASEKMIDIGRARIGNISFANSDTAWDAYAHSAIAEAHRAAGELAPA